MKTDYWLDSNPRSLDCKFRSNCNVLISHQKNNQLLNNTHGIQNLDGQHTLTFKIYFCFNQMSLQMCYYEQFH